MKIRLFLPGPVTFATTENVELAAAWSEVFKNMRFKGQTQSFTKTRLQSIKYKISVVKLVKKGPQRWSFKLGWNEWSNLSRALPGQLWFISEMIPEQIFIFEPCWSKRSVRFHGCENRGLQPLHDHDFTFTNSNVRAHHRECSEKYFNTSTATAEPLDGDPRTTQTALYTK